MAVLRAVIAAALAAALITGLQRPHRVFSFDPDEGVNLMKAAVVDRGAVLYREVWSDQPPLFTALLRYWCDVFGWQVDIARALVLLFAAAAVFALYDLLRLEAGDWAALAGSILLTGSAIFSRLAVSVMIGLPAVGLATLSSWSLFRWRAHRASHWVTTAGIFMGAAIATKLFVVVLVPVFAVSLFFSRARRGAGGWRPAALWLSSTAVTAIVLLLVFVGRNHWDVLWLPHLVARNDPYLARFGAGGLILSSLADWPLTAIGIGGAAFVLLQRRWSAAVFPAWIGAAAAVLLAHRPIWYHHALLLTVPYAAAGGIAIGAMLRRSQPPWMRITAAVLMSGVLLWAVVPTRLPPPLLLASGPATILASMRGFDGAVHTVVTNEPMYPFRAGYGAPAELAAMPRKRVAADPNLPNAIATVFAAHPPEQVVLDEHAGATIERWMDGAMGTRYRLAIRSGGIRLLVRSDLPDLGSVPSDGH